jgi:hypothetical protein
MNPSIAGEDNLVNTLSAARHSVRVTEESARWFLLINKSRIIGGEIRYYQMKHLGLGIYEVRLLPPGKKDTVLVEIWKTVENGL